MRLVKFLKFLKPVADCMIGMLLDLDRGTVLMCRWLPHCSSTLSSPTIARVPFLIVSIYLLDLPVKSVEGIKFERVIWY